MRWPVLAFVGVAAFVLGYVGFREYFQGVAVDKSTLDLVYLTVQLYALESGSVVETDVPWQLEVARLAAPATTATALFAAVAVAFQEQIAEWRLRRARRHIVVCGLGTAGARLMSELLDNGDRVVGIETNGLNPTVAALRRRGAVVLIGDARDPDTLRRTHLDRASHLISLAGADDTNAEVVLQATGLVKDRPGPALICLAHIHDPELCALLRSDQLAAGHQSGFRIEFFNIDDSGARALIRDHCPFPTAEGDDRLPHVLVLGVNWLGQSLISELARQWRAHSAARGRPITITVVDPQAAETTDRLRRRYPHLDRAAQLVPIVADLDPLDTDPIISAAADIAYVCMDDDSRALRAALDVRRTIVEPDAVVVVDLGQASAMAQLIDQPTDPDRIRAFNVLDQTMRAEVLLGGTYELLARTIHEEYVTEQRRQGATAAISPAIVRWEELPESLKESNRDQAAHIGTKLIAIGRGIAPLTDWDADQMTFTDTEEEVLAEMEHDRWVRQRRHDGWTAGPKDITAKKTPYLVAWHTLSEDAKELDRQAVRAIPAFLARAGYQVIH